MVYRSMSSKELAGGCKARSGSDPWRGATLSVCVARFGARLLLSHKTKMHYTHYSTAYKAKTKASMREAELKSTHSICGLTVSGVLANSREKTKVAPHSMCGLIWGQCILISKHQGARLCTASH